MLSIQLIILNCTWIAFFFLSHFDALEKALIVSANICLHILTDMLEGTATPVILSFSETNFKYFKSEIRGEHPEALIFLKT